MDYNLIVSELEGATPFDLFRLQAAIGKLLEDPARLNAIKAQLRPGMEITWFDEQHNRLIPSRLLQIRRTKAVIEELESGKRWTIPLYMINLQSADPDLALRKKGVDRLSLRTGDMVGFEGRNGEEIFGRVIKLNPKRAKIETPEGIWAVPYSMLYPVIEGEQGRTQLIPAKR